MTLEEQLIHAHHALDQANGRAVRLAAECTDLLHTASCALQGMALDPNRDQRLLVAIERVEVVLDKLAGITP